MKQISPPWNSRFIIYSKIFFSKGFVEKYIRNGRFIEMGFLHAISIVALSRFVSHLKDMIVVQLFRADLG